MADSYFPTTLAAAITSVRDILDEGSAAFWSDAEITRWIQLGVVTMTGAGDFFEGSGDITLVASQLEYSVPTDIIKVEAAIYNGSTTSYTGLVEITPKKIAHLLDDTPGPPAYYYHFAEKIGVWPLPTATEATKKVKIYGYKITDNIESIDEPYQPLAIWFAASMAFWKDNKPGMAAQFYAMFANGMGALKSNLVQPKEEPDAMTDRKIPIAGVAGGGR